MRGSKSATKEYPSELPGPEYKMELFWGMIAFFLLCHLAAVYGFLYHNSCGTIVFSELAAKAFFFGNISCCLQILVMPSSLALG
jgi:hypothetical protein